MTTEASSPTELYNQPRSCYCGEVTRDDLNREIVVKGWVQNHRDHGGIYFVDLRDREGLLQIVFDPDELSPDDFGQATRLKYESVIAARGIVRDRLEGKVNPNMKTGEIEVLIKSFEILSLSETIPFPVDEYSSTSEDLRLKFRYLDLRRPQMQRMLAERAHVCRIMRRALDEEGFVEVETPMLNKSTPEGARDFLVPSRLIAGTFYALPQSPQIFKQLLMVGGLDKYYQIVKCFRDEDLRANRQPEFTQLDVEMSFITPDELFTVIEKMMAAIFSEVIDVEVSTPFDRIPYDEAVRRYGSDKPDRRFGLEIQELTRAFSSGCEFKVFNDIVAGGDAVIRGICVPSGGEKYSNTQLKPGGEMPNFAATHGAKGLAWFRVVEKEGLVILESSISKFFDTDCQAEVIKSAGASPGDLILIVAASEKVAANALGQLRLKIADDMELVPPGRYDLVWVTDFPLLDWSTEDKRWVSTHHPFTMPHPEDWDKLETAPGAVRSLAYDLALNGEEAGGGSIRIHRRDIQERVFRALGIDDDEAQEKFGFLMEAFRYGAPPHGGIAFGLDRIMMILLGTDSIRDVIAFPKTQTGACLMSNAPGEVDFKQLHELYLKSTVKKKEPEAES
jgi:aspartyl-tRNA synthetase